MPDGPDRTYEWTEAEWANTRAFMRAVERRSFNPMPAAEIREEFFADASPRGDAREIVDEAIALISDASQVESGEPDPDAWDEAATLLTESFAEQSICAREKPAYEVEPEYGGEVHYAACHIHSDEPTITGDD